MPRVTGIGGIFFRAHDREALAVWYRDRLGVPVQDWHGAIFRSAEDGATDRQGFSVWSLFPEDTTYFGATAKAFMVNFRVDDLEGLLASLRAAGCEVDEKTHADENGKFGWVTDPEGNRVELWEPPAA